jgi:glycosyltransferase involved in cell wall biosynthesis
VRVSLVITTYENPRALELVLAGVARQSRPPDEVLVADDGSSPGTCDVIDAFARDRPFPVHHIWQENLGFRKCAILNHAVATSTGDYLIFLDGDCIPLSTFVEAHARASRRGSYLTGSKVWLRDRDARALTPDAVRRGFADTFGTWQLRARRGHHVYLRRIPLLARLLDGIGHERWRGENSSTFKEHIERVNGFDERFSYGWEDADFGRRLISAGIMPRSIRYRCPVLHLDHPRPYRDADTMLRNQRIYDENVAAGVTATPHGLVRDDASRSPSR